MQPNHGYTKQIYKCKTHRYKQRSCAPHALECWYPERLTHVMDYVLYFFFLVYHFKTTLSSNNAKHTSIRCKPCLCFIWYLNTQTFLIIIAQFAALKCYMKYNTNTKRLWKCTQICSKQEQQHKKPEWKFREW